MPDQGSFLQAIMGPPLVVEFDVFPDASTGFRDVCVGMQVNLLVFHAAPKSFNHLVVHCRQAIACSRREGAMRLYRPC